MGPVLSLHCISPAREPMDRPPFAEIPGQEGDVSDSMDGSFLADGLVVSRQGRELRQRVEPARGEGRVRILARQLARERHRLIPAGLTAGAMDPLWVSRNMQWRWERERWLLAGGWRRPLGQRFVSFSSWAFLVPGLGRRRGADKERCRGHRRGLTTH